jgi:hypothetical protein
MPRSGADQAAARALLERLVQALAVLRQAAGDRAFDIDELGEHLVVDGVCGPASLAAMRRHGFARWRDVA